MMRGLTLVGRGFSDEKDIVREMREYDLVIGRGMWKGTERTVFSNFFYFGLKKYVSFASKGM